MDSMRGISLKIIGDSGPFSIVGKSICYKLTVEDDIFLIDCGAPLFELIGPDLLMKVKGVFGTHSHDDHKRTFTDLALFYLYEGRGRKKLPLITTEIIHEEYHRSSKSALERSLSLDSKRVVEVPYSVFVENITFGPRARYRIEYLHGKQGGGIYRIVDLEGNVVEPSKAKVFISSHSNMCRMLYCDDITGEWVEPSSYYDFSSDIFYESEKNDYRGENGRYVIKAINAHSWHGIPCFGLEITNGSEKLIVTSDTVYNPRLWEQLYAEKREQKLSMSRREFEASYIIRDDINNYIERTWSRSRYEQALKAYEGAVVLHDSANPGSVVHTDYPIIAHADIKKLILTHSPDDFVSKRILSRPGKLFRIIGDEIYEEIDDTLHLETADVYIKQKGKNFVGYADPEGRFVIIENSDGTLSMSDDTTQQGMRVSLYMEIAGGYYEALTDRNQEYLIRPDGRVEKVTYGPNGSVGELAVDHRDRLSPEVSVR